MEKPSDWTTQNLERRRRLHELLIALIRQQEEMELVDVDTPSFDGKSSFSIKGEDPARWLERNKRIFQKYQSLVRSAITLDALLDSEHCEPQRSTSD
ncbi:hypothetical protein [Prochlorococcus sp. MIT 1307]|uniref:hypothetical protein n=1 Tax=Prochlorococcus sp. MIT 1307 TaxID=3096219 RepID=UPI002A749FA7|nr:hypothetical protein [Prochlorococcus sp. MIT 1307]